MSVVDVITRWLRRRPAGVAAVLVALVALVWWAWPTWSGHDDQLGVLVVGDEFLASAERSLLLRIREDGRSADVSFGGSDWCNAADSIGALVEQLHPHAVVASFAVEGACEDGVQRFAQAVGERRLVVVLQPGRPPVGAATATDAEVVDPSPLIGAELVATRLGCQWWEDCPEGAIDVRDDTGAPTPAGAERIARLVVAAL